MSEVLAQWLELTRHRMKLCRIFSKSALGRAWRWWYAAACVTTASSIRDISSLSDSYREVMTHDLALVGHHRELREIQEFQRSFSGAAVAEVEPY